jgi:phage protein D
MGDIGASSAFFPSRPAFLVDGYEVPGLSEGLLSLSITESTDGLFCCEACFGNWGSTQDGTGFLYFDRDVLEFGKSFQVEMGDEDTRAPVFEGRIMALEGRFPRQRPPELQILADDRCQDLRMTRRTQAFEDVNDQIVFERIAGEHRLRAEIDVDGPDYRTLAQVNQSDLAFLRERARAIDAEVWVEGDALFAQARGRRRAAADVELTYGRGLREVEIIADLANQRTTVKVSGWDVGAKESITEIAAEDAIRGELNGGISGSAVLSATFGERPEQIVHSVPLSSSEAMTVAEANYRALARRFVYGEALAEGDARIKVATHVDLSGLGPLFDGIYYVTRVCHTFDGKNGFLSRMSLERPGIGATR